MRANGATSHRPAVSGISLVELLFVIGIVAVLVAILAPSLGRARSQARRVKCMTNQKTFVNAVYGFAAEHQGFAQALIKRDVWRLVDSKQTKYVYEEWPWDFVPSLAGATHSRQVASPWFVAYASYIGAAGFKSADVLVAVDDPRVIRSPDGVRLESGPDETPAEIEALQCPADVDPLAWIEFPAKAYGRMSYAISRDIFSVDVSGDPTNQNMPSANGDSWRRGEYGAPSLEGRLDRIIRPAEVLMIADGGGSGQYPTLLNFHSAWGPTYSDYAGTVAGAESSPFRRHDPAGGMVGVYADGHGTYMRPVKWGNPTGIGLLRQGTVTAGPDHRLRPGLPLGIQVPRLWSPNPRITPYEPWPSAEDLKPRPPGKTRR